MNLEKLNELDKETKFSFDRWLNILDLEKILWATSDKYDKLVRSGAAREGRGNAKELREEVEPLISLGKSSLLNFKKRDSSLEFKTNFKNEKVDNSFEFDAKYRWRSYQSISSRYDSEGYVEVTCCLIDGYQTKLEHEFLTEHKVISGNSTYKRVDGKVVINKEGGAEDFDKDVEELSDTIIGAFKKKLSKKYPPNTTLVLWLSDAANVRYSWYADLEKLDSEIQALNCGRFQAVFLVGWNFKGRWIIGDGLP